MVSVTGVTLSRIYTREEEICCRNIQESVTPGHSVPIGFQPLKTRPIIQYIAREYPTHKTRVMNQFRRYWRLGIDG